MAENETRPFHYAGELALWYQAGCGEPLEFLGCFDVTSVVVPRGEQTPNYCRVGSNEYRIKRKWRNAPGLGQMNVVSYDLPLNVLAELEEEFNLYVFFRNDKNLERIRGYQYFYMFRNVSPNSENNDSLVAGISGESNAAVMLNLPCVFDFRLKVKKLTARAKDLSDLSANDYTSVFFRDKNFGLITTVGPTAKILRTQNGRDWDAIASPFLNVNDPIVKVAVGEDLLVSLNGATPRYAYSLDEGDSWARVNLTTVGRALLLLGGSKVWIVGDGGYIYFSETSGATIDTVESGQTTTEDLLCITAKDGATMYIGGRNNTFLRTQDGGDIWETVEGPASDVYPNDIYSIWAIPDTDILFAGDESGNVYRSDDMGDTWELRFVATEATQGGVTGVCAADCNIIAFVANTADPYWYDNDVSGSMRVSIDGGNSWEEIELPDNTGLRDITVINQNQYWVVGDDAFAALVAGPSV